MSRPQKLGQQNETHTTAPGLQTRGSNTQSHNHIQYQPALPTVNNRNSSQMGSQTSYEQRVRQRSNTTILKQDEPRCDGSCERDLKGLRKENATVKQENETLHQQFQSLIKKLEDTRSQLEKSQIALKESDRKRKIATAALAKSNKADTFKLDDAYFQNCVADLRYAIKNWIAAQTLVLPKGHSWAIHMTRKNRAILKDITVWFEDFGANSDSSLRLLLQAYIWKQVTYLVEEDLWIGSFELYKNSGSIEEAYRPLGYHFLKDELKKEAGKYSEPFNEWRATTARLMAGAINDEQVMKTTQIFTYNILKSWEPLTSATTPLDEVGLLEITTKAMNLAQKMAMQRAIFHFERVEKFSTRRDRFVHFQPETMETSFDIEGFRGVEPPLVVCAAAPGLQKAGNSDGKDLTKSSLIVKTEVVMGSFASQGNVQLQ